MLRFDRALFRNIGPMEDAELTASVSEQGTLRPLLIVGRNGAGKTLALAHIADALVEFTRVAFPEVEHTDGLKNSYFKVNGPTNQRAGSDGGLAGVQFAEGERHFGYVDKTGNVPRDAPALPAWVSAIPWADEGNDKRSHGMDKKWAEETMKGGAFAFFPASRREIPHWLNPASKHHEHPSDRLKFTGTLGRPLVVESAATENRQWLLDVFLDSMAQLQTGPDGLRALGNVSLKMLLSKGQANANILLKSVLDDDGVELGLMLRNSPTGRLNVVRDGKVFLPSLGNLSSGQAVLLNLFLTVIRYADAGNILRPGALGDIEGTVLVDEIDAHLHTDHQHRLLPRLLRLFPKVQWIISTHSPLFLLGMRNEYGEGGFNIVELPTGRQVEVEEFEEFGRAFEAFQDTGVYRDRVRDLLKASRRPLVLTEGKTDPEYIRAALRALGHDALLSGIDIESVSPNEGGGKENLNRVAKLWRGTPSLRQRSLLLLYDCDALKPAANGDGLWVRGLPPRDGARVRCGIENLLPDDVVTDEFYRLTTDVNPDGGTRCLSQLDKARLCESVCGRLDANDFVHFGVVVEIIAEFADAAAKFESVNA